MPSPRSGVLVNAARLWLAVIFPTSILHVLGNRAPAVLGTRIRMTIRTIIVSLDHEFLFSRHTITRQTVLTNMQISGVYTLFTGKNEKDPRHMDQEQHIPIQRVTQIGGIGEGYSTERCIS